MKKGKIYFVIFGKYEKDQKFLKNPCFEIFKCAFVLKFKFVLEFKKTVLSKGYIKLLKFLFKIKLI
ncbi:hypothetical protein DMC01_02920 [Campylobacter troglodytis]|nr:hypothetical protein DMC01_02920 [Campylobacter troglodytis]